MTSIGKLKLDYPFLLAPLAGITDGSFRKLCREMGAALVYTEMVSAKGLWYEDKKTFDLLKISDGEEPVAFQIFGRDPEILASAANRFEWSKNALLDINMGCPVPKIVKNGEGSALLREPELAGRLIEAMVSKSSKPVTAKIRLGWDRESINAAEVAKTLEAAGAAAIAVHGRTREQYYGGKADRREIAKVKAAVNIPVIANGDVLTGRDALALMDETGCDMVMIARGALGNPWIFRDAVMLFDGADEAEVQAAEPSRQEKVKMFLRHADLVREEKGEFIAVREMRKHAGWYFKGHRGVNTLKNAVNHIEDIKALKKEIDSFGKG